MGAWEDQEGSAYSCGCDPGMRREHKQIGYQCRHYPDCTYGRSSDAWQTPMTGAEFHQLATGGRTRSVSFETPIGIGGAPTRATTLPTDAAERKQYPVGTGVLDYFPDAIVALAHLSWKGNEQHNANMPLHWDRSKSADEADTMIRHYLQRGTFDTDGVRHTAKLTWRAMALLQKEIEAERER